MVNRQSAEVLVHLALGTAKKRMPVRIRQ